MKQEAELSTGSIEEGERYIKTCLSCIQYNIALNDASKGCWKQTQSILLFPFFSSVSMFPILQ